MKLYYSPLACSLAAHISCREAGLGFTLHRTDRASKLVEGGGDLRTLNPMGQVPTLVTESGQVLTENSAVLTYIADRTAVGQLAPAHGSDSPFRCCAFAQRQARRLPFGIRG
jgi:glutathione S-transferase